MSHDKNDLSRNFDDGINDLVKDIIGGFVSLDQVFNEIKFKPLQKKLFNALESKDDEDWTAACDGGTAESYQAYLSVYDKSTPNYIGKHVDDAKSALERISCEHKGSSDSQVELDEISEADNGVDLSVEEVGISGADEQRVENDKSVIDVTTQISETENADEDLSEYLSAWDIAQSIDTLQAYRDFINKYGAIQVDLVQALIMDAQNRLLSIQDDEDWKIARKTNTKKGYDKYIAKYRLKKSEFQGKYIDVARRWIPGRPNPRYKYKYIALLCVLLMIVIGVICLFTIPREKGPIPLTDNEVDEILAQYSDSLKSDLFDGFYLAPMRLSDLKSENARVNVVSKSDDGHPAQQDRALYSREDVIDRFMMNNGKFIVKNKYGVTIDLPEAANGIDSVCVKDSPFFEYIDNNGLRRVVALFKDDIYYYLGDCGTTNSGKARHILCNQNREFGIIDGGGEIIKEFRFYDIEPVSPNNYACKVNKDAEWVYYSADGRELGVKSDYPRDTKISSTGLVRKYNPKSSYFDTDIYGFQNLNGDIKIPYQFNDAFHFSDKGYAVVGKGKKTTNPLIFASAEKFGVIDTDGEIVLPFEYDDIYISVSDTIKVAKKGLYGMLNVSTKEQILPCEYEDCSKWNNGFCVKQNGRYCVIDQYGKKIIPDTYDYVGELSYGLARVKKGKNWYYIDNTGRSILGPYDDATWFDAFGFAHVSKNGKSGYINYKGETVIPFIFDPHIRPSFDHLRHLAQIDYDGIVWYINTNGAFAYPAKGSPKDQNISQQIMDAKAEAERKLKEKEDKAKAIKNKR